MIDTSNKFNVSANTAEPMRIQILSLAALRAMSRDDAILLAAWLVALTDPDGEQFASVLKQILST